MFSMLATRSSWRQNNPYGRSSGCHYDTKGDEMRMAIGIGMGMGMGICTLLYLFRTNLPNGHFRHDLVNDFFHILRI